MKIEKQTYLFLNESDEIHLLDISDEDKEYKYAKLSILNNVNFSDLVDEFMEETYPNGFPDDDRDIIDSIKYWKELEKWAKEEKNLKLKSLTSPDVVLAEQKMNETMGDPIKTKEDAFKYLNDITKNGTAEQDFIDTPFKQEVEWAKEYFNKYNYSFDVSENPGPIWHITFTKNDTNIGDQEENMKIEKTKLMEVNRKSLREGTNDEINTKEDAFKVLDELTNEGTVEESAVQTSIEQEKEWTKEYLIAHNYGFNVSGDDRYKPMVYHINFWKKKQNEDLMNEAYFNRNAHKVIIDTYWSENRDNATEIVYIILPRQKVYAKVTRQEVFNNGLNHGTFIDSKPVGDTQEQVDKYAQEIIDNLGATEVSMEDLIKIEKETKIQDTAQAFAHAEKSFAESISNISEENKETMKIEKVINESKATKTIKDCQRWVDYDLKRYGTISDTTKKYIRELGFVVGRNADGELEVVKAIRDDNDDKKTSLKENTVED